MTRVDFHFNAPAKLEYACRLLRKAAATGARLVVTGESPQLRALDTQLWTFSALDFLPHCVAEEAAPAVLANSPIVLTDSPARPGLPHREVLVNLGDEPPAGYEAFERLIEVVGAEEGDRQRARARWRLYAGAGHAIKPHDVKESR